MRSFTSPAFIWRAFIDFCLTVFTVAAIVVLVAGFFASEPEHEIGVQQRMER